MAAFSGWAIGLAASLRRTKMTAMRKKYEHPLRQVMRLRKMILGKKRHKQREKELYMDHLGFGLEWSYLYLLDS